MLNSQPQFCPFCQFNVLSTLQLIMPPALCYRQACFRTNFLFCWVGRLFGHKIGCQFAISHFHRITKLKLSLKATIWVKLHFHDIAFQPFSIENYRMVVYYLLQKNNLCYKWKDVKWVRIQNNISRRLLMAAYISNWREKRLKSKYLS